ncbi:MAG: hypothetical protein QM589_12855 [Thermomicrobiales bacterium]
MDNGTMESWMGRLAGPAAEPSHPGFDATAIHANEWPARIRRVSLVISQSLEEDAGPAMHPFLNPDTEKARCANTGLLRRSLDWMLSETRLDRRQTA